MGILKNSPSKSKISNEKFNELKADEMAAMKEAEWSRNVSGSTL